MNAYVHPAKPLLDHAMQPMKAMFADPSTQEVALNRPGEVWWRRSRGWDCSEVPELDFEALEAIAMLAGAMRSQDVTWQKPLLSTEMPGPGGELLRLQVCMPPVVPGGTISLTWRRPGSDVDPLDDLPQNYDVQAWNQWGKDKAVKRGFAEPLLALYDAGDAVGFLREAMRVRMNIWLCAATGGGKTHLFKSLMGAVSKDKRVVTVEDSLELQLPQENVVRLLYQHGGTGATAEDLIVAALRMRPDLVPVQEIRTGEAAWVYFNAVNTGHPGSPTTIHGNTPAMAFRRAFTLCKTTPGGGLIGDETLGNMIGDAVDIIIPLRNDDGGFSIREVWFKDAALREGKTPLSLLTDA